MILLQLIDDDFSLVKIKSFKEMISLNYVKADAFCRDLDQMIQ